MQFKTIILTSSLYKPAVGGIETSLHAIGKVLQAQGITPVVVCSDQIPTSRERLPAHQVIDGANVYRYRNVGRWVNFTGLSVLIPVVQAWRLFRRLSRKIRINMIIARQPTVGLAAAGSLPGVPVVYIVPSLSKRLHNQEFLGPWPRELKSFIVRLVNQFWLVPQNNWLQGRLIQRANVIVVFSGNMKTQLIDAYPSARHKIRVIQPGVAVERFSPAVDRAKLRCDLGLTEHGVYAISVGRLVPAKGYHVAIESLKSLKEFHDLRLLLVGAGPERERLEREALALGVESKVLFLGEQSNPEKFYRAADFYLMSSKYESFGHTILEAMASGLPIVGFRSDAGQGVQVATEEIVEEGRHGILCKYGSEGLANGIRRFLELPSAERAKLGHAGREEVVKKYTWTVFTQQIIEVVAGSEHSGKSVD